MIKRVSPIESVMDPIALMAGALAAISSVHRSLPVLADYVVPAFGYLLGDDVVFDSADDFNAASGTGRPS